MAICGGVLGLSVSAWRMRGEGEVQKRGHPYDLFLGMLGRALVFLEMGR